MPDIQLNQGAWSYDESQTLGPPGGFGEVFRGAGPTGPVAVKRLKLSASAAAHREMTMGQLLADRVHSHVVPVLDCGQDASSDHYFLVMPICDRSLAEDLAVRGSLSVTEARTIALDILTGLEQVDDIVHRDLKPGNVLLLDGSWRLADFGIAKFVEDSTSLQTLRGSLTPAYGAPEQWNLESPTRATDIYALGCMLHAMLNGAPPFEGSQDDIREAHLHKAPPELGGDDRLSAFVSHMLRKSPEARPSLRRCKDVIGAISNPDKKPLHSGLLEAGAQISREIAAAEAAARAVATRQRQRLQLADDAHSELEAIKDRLFSEIRETSDAASGDGEKISLGRGTLRLHDRTILPPMEQATDDRGMTWDVAASAILTLTRAKLEPRTHDGSGNIIVYFGRQTPDDFDYSWSSTLFFARSDEEPEFRWREISFWNMMGRESEAATPFAIPVERREFALAFSNTVSGINLAHEPFTIDGEDEAVFQHRWLGLFTKAAVGSLYRPISLPVDKRFFD